MRKKTEIIKTIQRGGSVFRLVNDAGMFVLQTKIIGTPRLKREPYTSFWAVTRFIDLLSSPEKSTP